MEPSTKTNPTKASDRVLSIDILRGFDMLMIIFADRFFTHFKRDMNPIHPLFCKSV